MGERNRKLSRRELLKLAGFGLGVGVGLGACKAFGVNPNEINAETPDPTEVEKRLKQMITEGQFNRVETGVYNPEALNLWKEIEPQPKIDPRIGICIEPSRYVRGKGSIEWHAKVAELLGFQRVAIPVSPPEFVGHTGIEDTDTSTLDKLLQNPEFESIFSNPQFKDIHLTLDIGGGGANAWQLPDKAAFTEERLQKTYEEAYAAANLIQEKWGHLGKIITCGFSNEIELHAKGGYRPETEDEDISPVALENGIKYFNTVFRAIRDANAAHPGNNPLLTSMEVLQIRRLVMYNDRNAITGLNIASGLDVLPDELTLSCWQFSGKGDGGYWPEKAMEKMRSVAPNVAITEYGVADGDRLDLPKDQVAAYYPKDIKGALAGGAKYIDVWGLTGFNSEKNFPNNKEERGLGILRPDGTIRKEVYEALQDLFR